MPKKVKSYPLHWINLGMFPGQLLFSCGNTHDQIIKKLKKIGNCETWILGIENEKTLIDGHRWLACRRDLEHKEKNLSATCFYIILADFDFSDEHFTYLAHEVLHICQFHLPEILDRNKEHEAEAYLHTYLMEKCLKILRGKIGDNEY